jgi:hypothetical protein
VAYLIRSRSGNNQVRKKEMVYQQMEVQDQGTSYDTTGVHCRYLSSTTEKNTI